VIYRCAAALFGALALIGCAATDDVGESSVPPSQIEADAPQDQRQTVLRLKAGADCPGTAVALEHNNDVLCFFTYPTIDAGSRQKIVTLSSGADCPGRQFDGVSGILCLVQYPRGWTPYVYAGRLYYKIDLAES